MAEFSACASAITPGHPPDLAGDRILRRSGAAHRGAPSRGHFRSPPALLCCEPAASFHRHRGFKSETGALHARRKEAAGLFAARALSARSRAVRLPSKRRPRTGNLRPEKASCTAAVPEAAILRRHGRIMRCGESGAGSASARNTAAGRRARGNSANSPQEINWKDLLYICRMPGRSFLRTHRAPAARSGGNWAVADCSPVRPETGEA